MRISKLKDTKNYSYLIQFIFWAQKKKYGEILLPSLIWGRSVFLKLAIQFFYRAIDRKKNPISPELRTLLSVFVSKLNGCEFCYDIGVSLAIKRGLDSKKVECIKEFERDERFSQLEKAALKYALQMTEFGAQVSDEVFETLKKYFTEDEIIELTAIIAFQNMSSRFNSALQIPSQGFCKR